MYLILLPLIKPKYKRAADAGKSMLMLDDAFIAFNKWCVQYRPSYKSYVCESNYLFCAGKQKDG